MKNFILKHRSVFLILMITLFSSYSVSSLSSAQKETPKSDDNDSVTFTTKEFVVQSDFANIFADIAEEVTPSVVSVIPTQIDTVTSRNNPFYSPFFGDDFFDQFLYGRKRGNQQNKTPQFEKREQRREGLGSGVIISKDGYVLTNFHVVNGADELKIKLNDGREYDADIIGADSLADVAVIKIKGNNIKGLKPIKIGDSSKMRPGDWTVAIGNPFSLTASVSMGIVSALGRQVQAGAYQNFIQTDAAINPGNSGGALLNIKGELIGINTMIFSKAGGFNGIGFAVPVNMAKRIMDDIIEHGKVIRGWIGVSIQDISPTMREAMDIGDVTGTLLSAVHDNMPAAKAGLKNGDIVTAIDGEKIKDANHLKLKVAELRVGKAYPFTIYRDGKKMQIPVTITSREEGMKALSDTDEERVPEKNIEATEENLGITLKKTDKGVEIASINPQSYNIKRYLKVGDIISAVKLSGKKRVVINDPKDFTQAIRKAKKGTSMLLEVKRNNATMYISFRL